ncbi:MAG: archease [Asgard group archaeon]|nr:archease [Asgard group archaeon]
MFNLVSVAREQPIYEDVAVSYEYLEHTADTIVHAKGSDLKEAFEQAALGYYNVLTDTKTIEPKIEKELIFESEDYESLLFDWIDNLIYLFGTELFIASKIQVTTLKKIEDNKFTLTAILHGDIFDLKKHPQESEVKAMTYSFMKIGEDYVEFTLDL